MVNILNNRNLFVVKTQRTSTLVIEKNIKDSLLNINQNSVWGSGFENVKKDLSE